ncbi:hypothetical protein L2U01_13170 [Staphylococcus aureus]|uniref:hypothetical protein n=1 Tax=Staphylococcus capitis TaxID=29388 RepID=UPI002174EBDF|nr:hypothetical protein [Staphylococcus aureus]
MHSPIIYLIPENNEINYNEKDVRLSVPNEYDLQDMIAESDWLVPDTSSEDLWHRGSWDIKEILEESHYGTVTPIDDDFVCYTITEKDIIKYQKELLEENEKFNSIVREYQEQKQMVPYFLSEFDQLKYRELHGDISGGIQFVELPSESIGNLDNGYYGSVDNSIGLLKTLQLRFTIDKNKNKQSYIVPLHVQGDYHY